MEHFPLFPVLVTVLTIYLLTQMNLLRKIRKIYQQWKVSNAYCIMSSITYKQNIIDGGKHRNLLLLQYKVYLDSIKELMQFIEESKLSKKVANKYNIDELYSACEEVLELTKDTIDGEGNKFAFLMESDSPLDQKISVDA